MADFENGSPPSGSIGDRKIESLLITGSQIADEPQHRQIKSVLITGSSIPESEPFKISSILFNKDNKEIGLNFGIFL